MADIKPIFGVDYSGPDELLRLCAARSRRSIQSMVKDLAYYAGQSAVKMTPPGNTNLRGLRKKYRIRKQRNRRGKKMVLAWDKELQKMRWVSSPPASEKVPHAGAAKAGFVQALRAIGAPEPMGDQVMPKLGYGIMRSTSQGYLAKLGNRTSYAAKIAAAVPEAALRKAEARLIGKLWRSEERKITKGS